MGVGSSYWGAGGRLLTGLGGGGGPMRQRCWDKEAANFGIATWMNKRLNMHFIFETEEQRRVCARSRVLEMCCQKSARSPLWLRNTPEGKPE